MKNTVHLLTKFMCILALGAGIFSFSPVQAETGFTPEMPLPEQGAMLSDSDIYVNPEYSDVIDEADLQIEAAGEIEPDGSIESVTAETVMSAEKMTEVVRSLFLNRVESGSITFNISKAEIPEVTELKTFFRYFVRKAVAHNGYPDQGDYLMYQYGGFNAKYSYYPDDARYRGTVTFTLQYYTNADQEKDVTDYVESVLDRLDLEGLHDIEKIRRIYKYICSRFEYDYEHLNDSSDYLKYTAYGGILRGKMVCQGFANLFYRMLLEEGIDTRIISGKAGESTYEAGQRHAWNIVKLMDWYYNMDATWDSNYGNNEYNYKYFLKSMDNFQNHFRGNTSDSFVYDYDTEAFSNEYPMSPADYIAVRQIVFNPSEMTLSTFGTDEKIPYTIVPENATIQTFSVYVSDTDVLHLKDLYWISAWNNGDASVILTADDGLKTGVLQVHASLQDTVPVTGVTVSDDSLKLKKGTDYEIRASVEPYNASDQRVYWTSSNPEIVTVTADGRIYAMKRGTAVIKAYTDNSHQAQCTVTVYGDPERIAGSGRYQTSMKIADIYKEENGIDQFENIILANGDNFADALAGSYLSYIKNAPILITSADFGGTKPYEEVNAYINANLNKRGKIYVLGGEGAVPEEALTGLAGYEIKRLSGKGRYETNIEILKEAGVKDEEILVATGFNFADSLSASAVNRPILLVGDELNEEQQAYLDTLESEKYYILGGTGAVSETVEDQLAEYGETGRLSGRGRHETSVLIAETFCSDAVRAVLAYSGNFPDGLCAGPLASVMNTPLILTEKDDYAAAAQFCIARNITDGYVTGGTVLISDEAVKSVFRTETSAVIVTR